MVFSNPLRLMLDRGSPDESVLELFDNGAMELVAEVLDGAAVSLQNDGGFVVGKLAFRLGVDSNL